MSFPIPPLAIAAFILVDAIVVYVVVRRILAIRAALPPGTDLGSLRAFTKQLEETTEMHVRTNWSGDPETLPSVLEALIAQLEGLARERGYAFERALLKRSVAHVIERRDLIPANALRAAMKQVA